MAGNAAALAFAVGVSLFFGGLAGVVNLYKTTKVVLFAMPIFTLVVLSQASISAASRSMGLLSITATALTIALTIPMKAATDRLRPAVALKFMDEVRERRCKVLVPYIQGMCAGGQSRESLPSSDAAIMATNALLLTLAWVSPPTPWLPSAVALGLLSLSFLGRMYLWAHHFLDVCAGAATGAFTVFFLQSFGIGTRWGDVFVSLVLFVASIVAMQKRTRVFDELEKQQELTKPLKKG